MTGASGALGGRSSGYGYVLAYGVCAAALLAGLAYIILTWVGAVGVVTAADRVASLRVALADAGAVAYVVGLSLPATLLLSVCASIAAVNREAGGSAGLAVRLIAPAFAGAPTVAAGIGTLVALTAFGIRPGLAGGVAALVVLAVPTVTVRLMRVWREVPRNKLEAAAAVGASDIGAIAGVLWPACGRAFVREAFVAAAILAGEAAAYAVASQALAARCGACPMPLATRVLGQAVLAPQAAVVESLVLSALVAALYAMGALVGRPSRVAEG